MYKINKNILFELNNSNASQEKAENVVKLPSTPIIKKYLIKSSDKLLINPKEIKQPIKKDPITLIHSVA